MCRTFCIATLSIVCLGLFGCSRAEDSRQNMFKLIGGIVTYYGDHEDTYPDQLDQIKEYVGGEAAFNELMKNPLTGDDPGYEYVKPQTGEGAPPMYTQIVLYQLRDGKRDMTLKLGYADGSVRFSDDQP